MGINRIFIFHNVCIMTKDDVFSLFLPICADKFQINIGRFFLENPDCVVLLTKMQVRKVRRN